MKMKKKTREDNPRAVLCFSVAVVIVKDVVLQSRFTDLQLSIIFSSTFERTDTLLKVIVRTFNQKFMLERIFNSFDWCSKAHTHTQTPFECILN